MKPVKIADIARAIANLATARGNASSEPIANELIERTMHECRDSLAKSNVRLEIHHSNPEALGEAIRLRVLDLLEAADDGLADAALPQRFHAKIARVTAGIQERADFDGVDASARLEELMYDLLGELTEPQFLRIGPEERQFFDQTEPLFGPSVDVTFPDSARDVAAAGRCFALGEWTACVYHLMRAVEGPLHVLADKVNAEFPKPIEFENWKNIVDKIDSAISKEVKHLENTGASHTRNDALKVYGGASLQIRHFKNAWRNDAAHGREHYDEREAERVLTAVKSFMQIMADLP